MVDLRSTNDNTIYFKKTCISIPPHAQHSPRKSGGCQLALLTNPLAQLVLHYSTCYFICRLLSCWCSELTTLASWLTSHTGFSCGLLITSCAFHISATSSAFTVYGG